LHSLSFFDSFEYTKLYYFGDLLMKLRKKINQTIPSAKLNSIDFIRDEWSHNNQKTKFKVQLIGVGIFIFTISVFTYNNVC
tara:strand:+ start:621 stop:863 length:243 start_codon:yes stop_codon:yes gene_type:complete